MAIYSPDIQLSKNDRRVIATLSELLDPVAKNDPFVSKDTVVEIAVPQAEQLLAELKAVVEDGEVLLKSRFVERLSASSIGMKGESQLTFEHGTKRRGRKSAMMSKRWNEFQARLGMKPDHPYFNHVPPMEFTHFLKMERRLLKELGLHPAVIELLIRLSEQEQYFILASRQPVSPRHGQISLVLLELLSNLEKPLSARTNFVGIRVGRLSAATLLIADSAVFFTTRDWSVTGVMSANAAAAINLINS